jgi:succinoglycan biosynthesis transport protein ExoP
LNIPNSTTNLAVRNSAIVEQGSPYSDHQDTQEFGIDLKIIYQLIRRNFFPIIGIIALTIGIGLIITLLTTPKYSAVASVQIDQAADRILESQNSEPAPSNQDADRFLQTQTDVLRSRTMAQRVGQRLGLIGNPSFFEAMGAREPTIGAPLDQIRRDASIDLIYKHISITLRRGSRVAEIEFQSADPGLSARMVNAYARGFIEYNLQRKFDASSYARSFLSTQLAEAKARLEGSERALNAYARSASLIKTNDAGSMAGAAPTRSVTTSSLVQMNQAANDAETARIGAEQKWRSAASVSLMNLPDVLGNPAIQGLLQQRATKTAELSNEMATHKAAYPSVLNLQAQVNDLDRQIGTLAKSIRSSIHDSYLVALRQEQSIKGQVASLKGATLAEQDRGVRYNILAREADTNRTLYDGLLQRYKEVSAEAGITNNNISIVDEWQTPRAPSSPKLVVNLALALLAGILFAVGFVFAREQLDDAVRGPQDVERKLGLHLLGVIPKIGRDESLAELLSSPRTNISEAYHALRTSLMYSRVEGLPRTMLVTSSEAAEGKSTTSFALAADLARLGMRVVLVDTDMRRPSLHRFLEISNAIGLSSVLTHHCEIEQALVAVNGTPSLRFLPAGPISPSPTELLGSARMSEVLHQLATGFDAVVLDGPPVLGLADAPILAAQAEATLFIVEAGRGRRGATKSAIRRLNAARGKLLGAILTKFDARKAGASDYYGYNYYHYGIENDAPSSRPRLQAD